MRRIQQQSLSTRLFGPLIFLLFSFVLLFGYLAWNFRVEYSLLSQRMAMHSKLSRNIIEIARTRARTLEALLMYRLNGDASYIEEIISMEKVRLTNLNEVQQFAGSQESLRSLGSSLVSGLIESSFLRKIMIESVRNREFSQADQAFRQLSIIFEINSARLKDFTLKVENSLQQDERGLLLIVTTAFWSFVIAIIAVGATGWIIAVFYRTGVLFPMQQLHRGLQSLAEGNLKSRVHVESAPRELYEMVNDFNHMANSLEASQEQVNRALRLRDEFLSIASHELKTPLTSLRLQAQLHRRRRAHKGAEGITEEKLDKFSEQIDAQVNRLNVLVDEMLDISRIQSGKMVLRGESVDLAELAKGVCEDYSDQIRASGNTIHCNLGSAIGTWDKHRMEQVVVNLITNAMKYGAGRPIHLEVFQKNQTAVLKVRDEGAGISADNLERIFDRFERANTSSAIPGMGLGLYIVKKIVSAHKGSVQVQSEPGKGATFTVELPLGA